MNGKNFFMLFQLFQLAICYSVTLYHDDA